MGIFGSNKKTYVSSVAYNLAGAKESRPNYLKTVINTNVLMDDGTSMGDAIRNSYLGGPGITMRSFGKWARRSGFNSDIGLISSSIRTPSATVNAQVLIDNTPHGPDETVVIQTKNIGPADYSYWVDRWMLENHPDKINSNYESDLVGTTVTVTFEDSSVETFTAVDFNTEAEYLYYSYSISKASSEGPIVPGTTEDVTSFPVMTGWDTISDSLVPTPVTLNKTVAKKITYSDGRPEENTSDVTPAVASYDKIDREYKRETYKGKYPGEPNKTYSLIEYAFHEQTASVVSSEVTDTQSEDIGGGVIKTTITTTTTETLDISKTTRVDEQEKILTDNGPMQIVIYRKGSGNAALDALFSVSQQVGTFIPYLPIRLDNKFLSETNKPAMYKASKKGFKKAFKKNQLDKIIEKLEDNPDLKDIDYAYVIFGSSLNTQDKAALKYVYKFFETILNSFTESGGDDTYAAFKVQWDAAKATMTLKKDWDAAQSDPNNPLYGTPEPAVIPYPNPPARSINIKNNDRFNITLEWSTMTETIGVGLSKPGAKKNDLWWSTGADEVYEGPVFDGTVWATMFFHSQQVSLYWQESKTSYRRMTFNGLKHINNIYNGKSVEITAKEALEDIEESGFIVPLHEDIYNSMRLVDRTQIATADAYLLLNCYKTVKKKWYQTGWFKVLLIVVIIVVSIFFPPAGAASGGILGANAAVGAALGLAAGSVAALVVGAIVNAVAAMVIAAIIQRGAVALFGDKVGAIIGAIAAVITVSGLTSMANGGTFTSAFSSMTRADTILAFTDAVGKGYQGYMNAESMEIAQKTQKVMNEYESQMRDISKAYADNIGYGQGSFDPLLLTSPIGLMQESSDTFLARTLMTGSEIADMTIKMVDHFVDLTLSPEL